jgi:hypothetical protein
MKFSSSSIIAATGSLMISFSFLSTTRAYEEIKPRLSFANEGVPPEMVGAFVWDGSITEGWAAGATFKNMHAVVGQKGYYQMSFVDPQTNFTRTSSGKSETYECVEGRPGHFKGTCTSVISAVIGNPPTLVATPVAFCHYVVVSQPDPDSDEVYFQWWDSNKFCNFTYEDLVDGSVKSPSWMYKRITPNFSFDDGRPACGYATEVVPVPGGGQLLPIATADEDSIAETMDTEEAKSSEELDSSGGNRRKLWFMN